MKWNILTENEPDVFELTGDTWDDGFDPTGKDWGDDESNAISNKQSELALEYGKAVSFQWSGE